MKCLTLDQPHASLMACFEKKIETRPRPWTYCGPVAIHAGMSDIWLFMCGQDPFASALAKHGITQINMPFGAILAVGQMLRCVPVEQITCPDESIIKLPYEFTDTEIAFGNYSKGRYAYIFDSMRRLRKPIPARGYQGVWHWNPPANLEELYES